MRLEPGRESQEDINTAFKRIFLHATGMVAKGTARNWSILTTFSLYKILWRSNKQEKHENTAGPREKGISLLVVMITGRCKIRQMSERMKISFWMEAEETV